MYDFTEQRGSQEPEPVRRGRSRGWKASLPAHPPPAPAPRRNPVRVFPSPRRRAAFSARSAPAAALQAGCPRDPERDLRDGTGRDRTGRGGTRWAGERGPLVGARWVRGSALLSAWVFCRNKAARFQPGVNFFFFS